MKQVLLHNRGKTHLTALERKALVQMINRNMTDSETKRKRF